MAHSDSDDTRDPNRVFVVSPALLWAGGIIFTLIGVIWGIWTANITSAIADLKHTNGKQWERLRELNDQGIKRDTEIEQFKKEGTDRESRLRALEHQWINSRR